METHDTVINQHLSGTSLVPAPASENGASGQRKLAIENALKLLQTETFCKAEQAMNFHIERFYPPEKNGQSYF